MPLHVRCRCSRTKVAEVLQRLGQDEAVAATEELGRAEVICEFCGQVYRFDPIEIVAKLVDDPDPQVRREAAIALRFSKSDRMPQLWAQLAKHHDPADRWSLEALGIGAELRWDECLAAWLKQDANWNTAAGRDIVWRSRAKATPALLAKILQTDGLSEQEQARYFRAFDFLTGPEKDQALESLLGL